VADPNSEASAVLNGHAATGTSTSALFASAAFLSPPILRAGTLIVEREDVCATVFFRKTPAAPQERWRFSNQAIGDHSLRSICLVDEQCNQDDDWNGNAEKEQK